MQAFGTFQISSQRFNDNINRGTILLDSGFNFFGGIIRVTRDDLEMVVHIQSLIGNQFWYDSTFDDVEKV